MNTEENAAFGLLHAKREELDVLLNETAEDAEDPQSCLAEIQRVASELEDAAHALTVTDFEDEYPEDGTIEGEIISDPTEQWDKQYA